MSLTFEALQIDKHFIKKLQEGGITSPSSVQAAAIPEVLAGKDVVAEAQTGTGKTLAYLLPVLQRLDAQAKTVQAVVLVPTRELGMQIVHEAGRLTQGTGLSALPLIGGAAIGRQIDKLRLHPQLVVGTPGRVLELIKLRKLSMHYVRTIVVDEVDQVFSLGSASEVEAIVGSALRDRQLLFFSATMPEQVRQVAERWMKEPVWLQVDPSRRTAETIEHVYFVCEERDKLDTLRRLVRLYNPRSAIVFINEIDDVAEAVAKMKYVGLSIEALYGEAGKQERAKVMNAFRDGRFQLLLATDVAARGLDIPGVTHVFNLDLPVDADHYVHRVGRTGRMGRKGTAISIVAPKERFIVEKFSRVLRIDIRPKAMYEGKVVDPEDDRSAAARRRRKAEAAGRAERKRGERPDIPDGMSGPRGFAREAAARGLAAATSRRSGAPGATAAAASRGSGEAALTAAPPDPAASRAPGRRAGAAASAGAAAAGARRGSAPAARVALPARARQKADRHRDRKNKGAPRWLKDKPPR